MGDNIFESPQVKYAERVISDNNVRYNVYEELYLGTWVNDASFKRDQDLYKRVQEYYSLIPHIVDTNVALVPGRWETIPDLSQVRDILKQSGWPKSGNKLVQFGALFGDFYLLVGQDRLGRWIIQPLDPRGVVVTDEIGLVIRDAVDNSGHGYKHKVLFTPRAVVDSKDDAISITPNTLGVIPLFYGQHKDIGIEQGINSFQHIIKTLMKVNELATWLVENLTQTLPGQIIGYNIRPDELEQNKDKIWFVNNPNGRFEILTGKLDVEGYLAMLTHQLGEIKKSAAENIWDDLRIPGLERPDSEAALRMYASKLTGKMVRARQDGYDPVLKQAVDLVAKAQAINLGDWEFNSNRDLYTQIFTQATESRTLVEGDV